MDAINRIVIDVSDPLTTQVVKAVQEDIRSRYVEITLVRNGEALSIPADAYATVGLRRPDGTMVLYDATEDETPAVTIDGNVVTAYLSQEALAVPGDMYTSVSLFADGGSTRLTAFHFITRVEATAVPSGAVTESTYFNILQEQIEDALDAADRAEAAAAGVEYPVSYAEQTLTSDEQEQARANISAMAANATPTPAAHHATHEAGGSDPITLPTASTSSAGIVQLYDGVDSTSSTLAATAAAVKAAYDKPLSASVVTSTETGGVAVPNDSWKKLASVSLTAGIWIISGYASMAGASNSSTKRLLCLSETSGVDSAVFPDAEIYGLSAGDGTWRDSVTIFAEFAESTTLYLNACQRSGSNITTTLYGIRAMKLS